MARFLFISGLQRSGTTALCRLLNHHPQVVIGIERYKFLYARRMDDVGPHLFERERFFDLSSEETNITAPADYRVLGGSFDAATHVGDKVPGVFNKFAVLRERLPGLTMIFIARRPDTVAASWQARADNPKDSWPAEHGHSVAVERWNAGMARALGFARDHPDSFVPVIYEELFSGRGDSLAALLDRLGLPASADLSRSHAEMTEGWAERVTRPVRLTREQAEHVRDAADHGLLEAMRQEARRGA